MDSSLAVALAALAVVVALFLAERHQRRRSQARAYLKGVRSMLSGDPDAAIEALSSAARLHTREAVETYLALGALFRRTGDLARAVRLHRNMLLGRGLDPAARTEIERELAEDYRRSGMLRESAEILERLAPGDRAAAEGLRDVLVEAGDLPAAAAIQRRLATPPDALLAHLLAACAREALERDVAAGGALAGEAVEAHPASADARLALAEAAARAGDTGAALEAVARALELDRRAATLAWPALCQVPDRERALAAIDERAARDGMDPGLAYLRGRLLVAAGRNDEALAAFSRAVELDATGEVTLALREVLRDAPAPGPEDLAARHDLLVKALLARARPVRCQRCTAEAASRDWRCRRCGAFEPYP